MADLANQRPDWLGEKLGWTLDIILSLAFKRFKYDIELKNTVCQGGMYKLLVKIVNSQEHLKYTVHTHLLSRVKSIDELIVGSKNPCTPYECY